ncbi:hypothetical protein GCM10022403_087850 [Streptomyces coacervatus]|uniref:Uncharacterized protein n=1 Tax=Streptomyces coacervatus TaxID=647381 RepID=A0ABP7JDG2_9ACTN|nr:hypothetical protein [Streptomyces coacervatus]MDF2273468.1 hypothetical protein [Streptomyces coacervatus]
MTLTPATVEDTIERNVTDLTGAQRFFDRDARGISELVRLRTLA